MTTSELCPDNSLRWSGEKWPVFLIEVCHTQTPRQLKSKIADWMEYTGGSLLSILAVDVEYPLPGSGKYRIFR
jgi:hypothetical protein